MNKFEIGGFSLLPDDKLNAELLRNSATELQLGQRDGRPDYVFVNGTGIDLSTPKTLTLGASIANLIEGGSPSASTLYNKYLSSSGVLGLSATAPLANGYRTGDPTNRFFGAVYLDASKECPEEWNFCGFGETVVTKYLASVITRTSGVGSYGLIPVTNVVCLPGTRLLVIGKTFSETSIAFSNRQSLAIGGVTVSTERGYQSDYASATLVYASKRTAIESFAVSTYYYYSAGTLVIDSSGSLNNLTMSRNTI